MRKKVLWSLGLGCKDIVWESPPIFKGIKRTSAHYHHNDRPSQALTGQILGLLSRTHCAQGGHHCLERRGDRVSAFPDLPILERLLVEMRKLPEQSPATFATIQQPDKSIYPTPPNTWEAALCKAKVRKLQVQQGRQNF